MKWFGVRKAAIPKDDRELFERYGATVIAMYFATGFDPKVPELNRMYRDSTIREYAARWLTEQYDRAERKETWSITMEFSITVFVLVEMILSLIALAWHYHWIP
jgi:hypothetical protein